MATYLHGLLDFVAGQLTGLAEDDPETQARLTGFRQGLEMDGRTAAMSAFTIALQRQAQNKRRCSRKSWSPCNPT
jgi:hypothetical protein